MRVFNLTDQSLVYGGRTIAPYGSEEVAIDFIPNRDLALQKAGVLSFGSLPKGWTKPQPKPSPLENPQVVKEVVAAFKAALDAPSMARSAFKVEEALPESTPEEKPENSKKKK